MQNGKLRLGGGKTFPGSCRRPPGTQGPRDPGSPAHPPRPSAPAQGLTRVQGAEGTSGSKVRGRWGEKARERGEVPAGPAHSSRSRHYLIAARAHWLVPSEAGPMRRSPLTPPAPQARPPPSHRSRRPHAAFRRPRATDSGERQRGGRPGPEGSVSRARVGQPGGGPCPAIGRVTLGNRPHLAEPPRLVCSAVKRSE